MQLWGLPRAVSSVLYPLGSVHCSLGSYLNEAFIAHYVTVPCTYMHAFLWSQGPCKLLCLTGSVLPPPALLFPPQTHFSSLTLTTHNQTFSLHFLLVNNSAYCPWYHKPDTWNPLLTASCPSYFIGHQVKLILLSLQSSICLHCYNVSLNYYHIYFQSPSPIYSHFPQRKHSLNVCLAMLLHY